MRVHDPPDRTRPRPSPFCAALLRLEAPRASPRLEIQAVPAQRLEGSVRDRLGAWSRRAHSQSAEPWLRRHALPALCRAATGGRTYGHALRRGLALLVSGLRPPILQILTRLDSPFEDGSMRRATRLTIH